MPYISHFIIKQLSKHLQDKVIFKSAELHVDSIQVCSHFKATEETEASKESRETRANDERQREVRRVSLTMGSSHKGLNVQKQRPCMKNGRMMWTETIGACVERGRDKPYRLLEARQETTWEEFLLGLQWILSFPCFQQPFKPGLETGFKGFWHLRKQ